ncbi:hypothetical protein QJS10_CPB11g00369 [Acorus calamus]|uniref:Uncharacterized protein n=1 Tax=Acorus calamus TaxID=4465 RepID=A0AAV9DPH1_ACOCL|nr:hypothetical protein QJS10_CPB11g00369 [Acorus calamus]
MESGSTTMSGTLLGHRVLSTIHVGIEVLFSDLSVSNIESILASYLDESVKLLDIYNWHRLLIRLVIHLLSSSSGAGEPVTLWELVMSEVVTLTARRGMPKTGLVTGVKS